MKETKENAKSLEAVTHTHTHTHNTFYRISRKNMSGVTLVALVVTVVILLILAGVSISTLFGEHGIIKKAQEAVDRTQEKVEEEQREFENLLEQLNSLGNVTGGGSEGDTEGGGDTPKDPNMQPGWDERQVNAVKSADNIVVPVPKGFTASEVSRKVTLNGKKVDDIENTVDGGFVIYQGTEPVNNENVDSSNARTERNQFVWVPVQNIDDIYDSVNNAGQLYDFGTCKYPKNPAEKIAYPTTMNDSIREPDVVTGASSGQASTSGSGYDASGTYLSIVGISSTGKAGAEAFKMQLENEFKDMKDSVEKYGGFYIGRYETGGLDTDEKSPAKVVKGQGDGKINRGNWYTMYQKNKGITDGQYATAGMVWGCQWDATMNWFLSQAETKPDVATYVTNGSGKGNYKKEAITYVDSTGATVTKNANVSQIISTGSSEQTKVNNIYDMAGNVRECSMEARSQTNRNVRRRLLL